MIEVSESGVCLDSMESPQAGTDRKSSPLVKISVDFTFIYLPQRSLARCMRPAPESIPTSPSPRTQARLQWQPPPEPKVARLRDKFETILLRLKLTYFPHTGPDTGIVTAPFFLVTDPEDTLSLMILIPAH